MQTTQEMTRSRKIKEELFLIDLLHPLPPRQDRFKQFPTPGPEKLDLSRGFPVTGQIEPCIQGGSTSFVSLFMLSIFDDHM